MLGGRQVERRRRPSRPGCRSRRRSARTDGQTPAPAAGRIRRRRRRRHAGGPRRWTGGSDASAFDHAAAVRTDGNAYRRRHPLRAGPGELLTSQLLKEFPVQDGFSAQVQSRAEAFNVFRSRAVRPCRYAAIGAGAARDHHGHRRHAAPDPVRLKAQRRNAGQQVRRRDYWAEVRHDAAALRILFSRRGDCIAPVFAASGLVSAVESSRS